ncbi:MAG: hypothetical protein NVSMB19_03520 [Vulcanimicrobiaceae bacterium]
MAKAPRYDGITAETPLDRAARVVGRELFEAVFALAPNVLRGDDTRAVHDMRVGIRRARVALATFEACFPAKGLRALRRATRRVGRKLGAVRDADVHLAVLRTTLGGASDADRPGIVYAIDSLLESRRDALAAFAIELSQFDRDAVRRAFVDA